MGKEEVKQIYHGDSCNGMVKVDFRVMENKVRGTFVDGDVGTDIIEWSYELNNGVYLLWERVVAEKPPRYEKPEPKVSVLNAKGDRDARVEMIEKIIEPYKKTKAKGFPVKAGELEKALKDALIPATS